MPKLLDPDCTFEVVLESDKDKDNPPAFIFRAGSKREFTRAVSDYESIDDMVGDTARIDKIFDIVRERLVGWKNMGDHTFDASKMDDILTMSEGIELMEKMLAGQELNATDAKN